MEFYDVMLADSNRLLNTVEQVLQASSTKERKRQFSASEIDIGELINESVGIVRTGRNLDEGAIRFSEPAEPIKIMGDAADMQTAFINLLDNALKYSSDSPKISIRTKKAAMNNRVDIFIKDNGIGIPSADLKRIFKRFYRVKSP